ncbi:MAG: MotA/TolQ/ExbB proton channel family protein [Verrucomicrobiaceae bacterium]
MKKTSTLLALLLTAGCLFLLPSLQAEEAKPAAKTEEVKITPGHTKTLWEQIKEGGWVMVPISLCSVLTLYLIGDGVIRMTNPKKLVPMEQVEAVRGHFRPGDYVGAYDYCKNNPSAFTNVCRVAISQLGEGKQAVEEGIMAEMSKENSRIQTFVSYLSVIGVCAPMIGLLGTVTGMIKAFATLGSSGIGDPSSLSAAIGEVLVATASGLFIAIPAFGSFYFLRNRAAKVMHDIQDQMASLLRKMPYDKLAGAHIGDEEIIAGSPNWLSGEETEAA